jgi:hypothetical protein
MICRKIGELGAKGSTVDLVAGRPTVYYGGRHVAMALARPVTSGAI